MMFLARGQTALFCCVIVFAVVLWAAAPNSVAVQADEPVASDDNPAPPPAATDDEPSESPAPSAPADEDDPAPGETPPSSGKDEDGPEPPAESESSDQPVPADEDQPAAEAKPDTSAEQPAANATDDDAPGKLPSAEDADAQAPDRGEPQSEDIQAAPERLQATMLQGVRPGETTREQLHAIWGEPKQVDGGQTPRETFDVRPYGKVRATLVDDVVDSLAISLPGPISIDEAVRQLQLENLECVEVLNDAGKLVGQAYPERGVMFGFAQKSNPPAVFQIVIEPLDAQAFLDRATKRLEDRYADCFSDIQRALELAPDAVRAHWLHAELTLRAGDLEQAMQSAVRTVELAPGEYEYRLTLAKVQAAVGDFNEAIKQVSGVANAAEASPTMAARAQLQWGDYLAAREKHDYEQAVRKHQSAVKLVEKLIGSPKYAERVAAKEVLVDAHLAVARDIGWGHWQHKSKVVPKWIERATVFADDLVAHEGASAEIKFRVAEQALAALAGVSAPPDAGAWVRTVSELGQRMLAQATDTSYRAHLAWRLAIALGDAVEIEATRQKLDRALALGNAAMEYFDQGEEAGKQLNTRDYLRGRLAYRLGAIFAVQKSEHERAIAWYDRAVPLLETPVPPYAVDCGKQGELFVSMAVSYWETNNRREALRLTNQGVKLMEQAADQGLLAKPALAVPYSNLASMHEQLGDMQEARRYSELAARYEPKR
jgi:tetratricopeptide (TPR) repeat protein